MAISRPLRSRWLPLLLLTAAGVVASANLAAAAFEQKTAWGSFGPGAGQFGFAEGVETDAGGHVYVADTNNHRIQKFSAGGHFILTWGWGVRDGQSRLQTCRSSCQSGSFGPGNGQLNAPNGVASDSKGHVYVADFDEDRIQKFSASGRFMDLWGSAGSTPGRFDGPVDVAVAPGGRVYVADYFNNRIQKFSPSGRFLAQWNASYPYGLAIDSSGHVYVAEYEVDRIEKFSSTGRFHRTWGWGVNGDSTRFQRCGPPRAACSFGSHGSGKGQFAGPEGIATDSEGKVYVADSVNGRIQKFSAGGRFLATWGKPGDGQGQLRLPSDVAANAAGRIYVVDTGNDRIVKYAQIRPQTTITAARVRSDARSAKFRFRSSEPGSTFKCKLNHRRFRPCASPMAYRRLGAGEHAFKVRAVGPDRLKDPSPARKRFAIEG